MEDFNRILGIKTMMNTFSEKSENKKKNTQMETNRISEKKRKTEKTMLFFVSVAIFTTDSAYWLRKSSVFSNETEKR